LVVQTSLDGLGENFMIARNPVSGAPLHRAPLPSIQECRFTALWPEFAKKLEAAEGLTLERKLQCKQRRRSVGRQGIIGY
jgi:hypothetical protein